MPLCPHCGGDLKDVFRTLAAKGGKAARGGVKRTHSADEYRAMQRKSVESRKRGAAAAAKAGKASAA